MKKTLAIIACASLAQLTTTYASGYLDECLDGRLNEIRAQNERIIEELEDQRDAQRHRDFMNNW